MPSGVTNLGPITAPELNNVYFVGSILYPTIQSAVTAAAAYGSGARVLIPYGATPSDTIATASGATGIVITSLNPTTPFKLLGRTALLLL